MTALVVLMNKNAAAVAADRAGTITDERGDHRVREGFRKLFELVPGKPISIMIYNSAEIMGNSWDPIIVRYAREAKDKNLPTVADYAEDFFRWLEKSRDLFPPEAQRRHFADHVKLYYAVVRMECEEILREAQISGTGPRTAAEALTIAAGRLFDELTLDMDDNPLPLLPGFDDGFGKNLADAYRDDITALIGAFFSDIAPDRGTVEKLRQIAPLSVVSGFFPIGLDMTGIVITGYGAKQFYPQTVAFEVQGVFLDRARRRLTVDHTVSSDLPVVVQPFAQDRMLRTLLFGLDPELPEYLLGELSALIEGTRDNLVQSVPELSVEAKRAVSEFLSEDYIQDMWEVFLSRLAQHVYRQYANPIFRSVSSLPEAALADAAENMVRITAFQQDVSGALPTVGGGIDVALVTSERFQWVKRAEIKG
ncbi:MAG: hypothetical protein H6923_03855 [Alphaproteobacteria bacterium]|nr:hypothetical protein [Alphaproteobacteria bacterium]